MSEEKKDQVKSTFSKYADAYATSQTHATGNDLTTLVNWLNPDPNDVGLDLATGGGHVVKSLAPHLSLLYATDLTREMLQNTSTYLTQFPNVQFVVADAENIPFLNDTFTIVTCRIAAHHFPNPEKFIQEAVRVLKPGGRFLLIDNVSPDDKMLAQFMNTFEEMRDPSHANALSIEQWKELLTRNGLAPVKEEVNKKTLSFSPWVNRTLEDSSQIEAVVKYFNAASPAARDYFEIVIEQNAVESFSLDQWMVMCSKLLPTPVEN
ncbi:SAM-dependent methyltransferase [Jeotgalibacillus sp. S-D1]|uniref:class I SAM-dependent methyltransferase n=1 Tax=Jeotgalibacillus sp. S-D1 TaxID=2552189 RepID=UPI0010594C63|nr:class I SAM-dependent methyltransferase [Jeotgalibacillus sp. S-D1]TDL31442.1 SAM-dependent methyltransferase [Jeotgalibacillus sp. S-D1]